jgi:hypothetical protein
LACPFWFLEILAGRDTKGYYPAYPVWEAISCYVRVLSETGIPDNRAVSAVTFFVEGLKSVNFSALREFVWAIQAVVGRAAVCQAIVDGVPSLPVELANHANWDDTDVRRGIVLIFGTLASASCRMPGYDRNIVVNAIMNDTCERVRCVAVWAVGSMILNSRNQNEGDQFTHDEVHGITQMLINCCHEESFLVCTSIITNLPRIVKFGLPSHSYRLIVADRIFEALARLAQHDAMREVARPILGLIADLFRTSLTQGWTEACVQAFENEDGPEILEALGEVQDNALNADVNELCRRLDEWKGQNRGLKLGNH